MASGCFDVFHYGHLCHLQASAKMGDYLVVALTRDRSVNKGPGRPIHDEHMRAEMLKALRFVNSVVLVDSSLEGLRAVKPNVFVKGAEYNENILLEDFEHCKKNRIRIVFTDEPTSSTTKVLRELRGG